MKPKILTISAFFFCMGMGGLHAQKTGTAAGGEAAGTGGTVSYSVGQLAYSTNTGTNGSVAQGVQQPYEISVVIGQEEEAGIQLSCSVYPNPATDQIRLKVEDHDFKDLSYQLSDMNGRMLQSDKLWSREISISMENTAKGAYILKVFAGNGALKVFKIVKN